MNVKNNRLVRETDERIIRTVYQMITQEHRPVEKITVREICERADIHRSTFYAHYQDVYDLVERVENHMSRQLTETFFRMMDKKASARECFTEIFSFIREYRGFYAYYLNGSKNSGVLQLASEMIRERYENVGAQPQTFGVRTEEEMEYHGVFFLFGMTALVRLWLKNDCREEPETLYDLLLHQGSVQKRMIDW